MSKIVEETGQMIVEQTANHAGKEKQLHLFKHALT